MKYRKLGKSELNISTVALGCWPFSGGELWGDQEQREIDKIVGASIDAGINLFDTAEGYEGSEVRLAAALGPRRKEVVIASKVNAPGTREKVRAACEGSLRRLQTDYIDVYQIHWPRGNEYLDETLGEFEKLKDEGKIRVSAVSNYGPLDLTDALNISRVDSNQLLYSMLTRMIEDDVVPKCMEHQVSILCYSPLTQGLLTGKWKTADEVPPPRARSRLYSSSHSATLHHENGCEKEVFAALEKIREICVAIGQPMATVALAWCIHKPGITSVLAGARSPEQVQTNADAGDLVLSDDTIRALDEATEPVKAKLVPNLDVLLDSEKSRIR